MPNFPPPQFVDPDHEKTGLGPEKCNNGALTENQCKTAAAQEGMAFMRVAGWNSYPGGCFCMPKSGAAGMCGFNKFPGKAHASALLLCKKGLLAYALVIVDSLGSLLLSRALSLSIYIYTYI